MALPQTGEEELQNSLAVALTKITELEGVIGMLKEEAAGVSKARSSGGAIASLNPPSGTAPVRPSAPLPPIAAAAPPPSREGVGPPPSLVALCPQDDSSVAALRECWAKEAAAVRLSTARLSAQAVEEALAGRESERRRADAALAALATARGEVLSANTRIRELTASLRGAEEGARERLEAVLTEVREGQEALERAERRRDTVERECEVLREARRQEARANTHTATSPRALADLYEGSLAALSVRVETLELAALEKDAAMAEVAALLRGEANVSSEGQRRQGVLKSPLVALLPLQEQPPQAPTAAAASAAAVAREAPSRRPATVAGNEKSMLWGTNPAATPAAVMQKLSLAGSSATRAASNAEKFGLLTGGRARSTSMGGVRPSAGGASLTKR